MIITRFCESACKVHLRLPHVRVVVLVDWQLVFCSHVAVGKTAVLWMVERYALSRRNGIVKVTLHRSL